MPRDETEKKEVNSDEFSKPELISQTNNSWNPRPELNFQQIKCWSMTSEKNINFKKNSRKKIAIKIMRIKLVEKKL